MSFSEKYLEIITRSEDRLALIRDLAVTEAFGVSVLQPESVAQLIYDLNYARDHGDTDYGYVASDDGEEEACAYDLGYCPYECSWDVDVNKAFEQYVRDHFEDGTSEELLIQAVQSELCLSLLLGGFYLSITENLYREASALYSEVKKEYPNEKRYPSVNISTDELTHYESSRCW